MAELNVDLPRSLPVRDQADVLVVGGGPGGIGAAVAAARGGADVLLVEHYGFLGGMATAGEVNPFMPNHHEGRSLDTGVFTEWTDRIASYGGLRNGSRVFDPNVARLAAEDLCLEAGVRLLYHHRAAHVQRSGRRIEGVVLHSKSGLSAATAATYVDSTGDGDVAALAGCSFDVGDSESGRAQPMTLCFKLKLDREDVPPDLQDKDLFHIAGVYYEQIQVAYKAAQASGRIDCPRENVLIFPSVDGDVVHFNTTRVIHRLGSDGRDLSAAEIEGRRQLRQIWKVLRADVPIFRNARLYSIAPQIGVRETRRIRGRAVLTVEDYKAARRYPDAVARITYPIDIHNPSGSGTVIRHLPAGQWYEVPWRCLLPVEVDNLVIASRCISADHATHSSLRVMPPVCSIGQAAGTAAAMAKRLGVNVCEIDGVVLNQALREAGRNLVTFESPVTPEAVRVDPLPDRTAQRDRRAAERFSA